ncbi:CTP synthase [bacterium]|jgi:CTP synthase|nr:CTP synthase [bacterium]MBU1435283.1 CTP synthase [bacterium]MBU1503142.1 CTP synthase [bacterium]
MTKYIFVTGGVLSSLGKGITAASVGTLLKHSGKKVGMLKIDPYINVDPGTMSPLEHGEVFVTKDGAETDLDIGNYERFLDTSFLKSSNFTTGQVYSSVIERERAGGYLGQTIQVIPHIVGEIVKRIKEAGEEHDILIVELGGTVGDIEGLPFMEAIRQMKHDEEVAGTFFIHVTLIPFIKAAGELKSKPTQHSVQELRRIGITPQMIIARSENALPKTFKKKLAMSCDVSSDSVIEALDAASIYDVPMSFLRQNILKPIAKELELGECNPDMEEWDSLVKKIVQPKNKTVVGFVGKYLELKEAYKSLTESLIHCGAHLDARVEICWVDSEMIEERGAQALLGDCDSVLVAGGFGNRGVEGKIQAIEYARVNKIPYLGICLGMQLTLVEYARNVLGMEGANSVEFDENTPYPMIYLIDNFLDQAGNSQLRTHKSPMGGTLRLGEYPCDTKDGSLIQKAYGGAKTILERHRHRYEANPTFRKQLEDAGMIVTGESNGLIEAVEIEGHPWFLGVQFHPEFTSRLQSPNPSILAFVEASLSAE